MNDDIGAQHPFPSDPGSFSEVPAGQHLTLGRMAEILRASGCVVYASSQPPIQKADIERLPSTEAEIEVAYQEGYNEGCEEGKSEWKGVKAQLWNAMQHWLALRHGLVDTTGEGYTVSNLLDGLSEVEAENKRLSDFVGRQTALAEAAETTIAFLIEKFVPPYEPWMDDFKDGDAITSFYRGGSTYGDLRRAHAELAKLRAQSLAADRPESGEAVAIKPLEWKRHWAGSNDQIRAWSPTNAVGGFWRIDMDGDSWTEGTCENGKFASLDEAKAAAQADYETRVRSALIAPPAPADNGGVIPMKPVSPIVGAFTDVLGSLVAAVSLLERGGKQAAPSNKMFAQMLKDYKASVLRGRDAYQAYKSATPSPIEDVAPSELTFSDLRQANVARQQHWGGTDNWTLADWSNALAGEVGEACNVVKKIRRPELGTVGNAADLPTYHAQLESEIGDVLIYLDLLALKTGVTLEHCVSRAFNEKSEKLDMPVRLAARRVRPSPVDEDARDGVLEEIIEMHLRDKAAFERLAKDYQREGNDEGAQNSLRTAVFHSSTAAGIRALQSQRKG